MQIESKVPSGMEKQYHVYILGNYRGTVLYVGITHDLLNRANEHASGLGGKFTSRYKVTQLLFFEAYNNPRQAIAREKEIIRMEAKQEGRTHSYDESGASRSSSQPTGEVDLHRSSSPRSFAPPTHTPLLRMTAEADPVDDKVRRRSKLSSI